VRHIPNTFTKHPVNTSKVVAVAGRFPAHDAPCDAVHGTGNARTLSLRKGLAIDRAVVLPRSAGTGSVCSRIGQKSALVTSVGYAASRYAARSRRVIRWCLIRVIVLVIRCYPPKVRECPSLSYPELRLI